MKPRGKSDAQTTGRIMSKRRNERVVDFDTWGDMGIASFAFEYVVRVSISPDCLIFSVVYLSL